MAAAMRLPVKVRPPITTSRPMVVIRTWPSASPCRMYSEIPIRVAARAPREWERAVRCGTAVIGIQSPMLAPTTEPRMSPTMIHR